MRTPLKIENLEQGSAVKICAHADFKYNNRRAGATGKATDFYNSDHSGEWIVEIEFMDGDSHSGFDLCRLDDLELA